MCRFEAFLCNKLEMHMKKKLDDHVFLLAVSVESNFGRRKHSANTTGPSTQELSPMANRNLFIVTRIECMRQLKEDANIPFFVVCVTTERI